MKIKSKRNLAGCLLLFVLVFSMGLITDSHAGERSKTKQEIRCIRSYAFKNRADSAKLNFATEVMFRALLPCEDLRKNRPDVCKILSGGETLSRTPSACVIEELKALTNLWMKNGPPVYMSPLLERAQSIQMAVSNFATPRLLGCKGIRIGARAALLLGVSASTSGMVCKFTDLRNRLYLGVGAGGQIGAGAVVTFRGFNTDDAGVIAAGRFGALIDYANTDVAIVLGQGSDLIMDSDPVDNGTHEGKDTFVIGGGIVTGINLDGLVPVAVWDRPLSDIYPYNDR